MAEAGKRGKPPSKTKLKVLEKKRDRKINALRRPVKKIKVSAARGCDHRSDNLADAGNLVEQPGHLILRMGVGDFVLQIIEYRLVFQTRDLAIVLGAARLDRANETRRPIAVIDLRQFPQLAFIARRQDLADRTDECVALRRSGTRPCGKSHCSPMIPVAAWEHTASSPPSRRPRCPRS